MDVAGSAVGIVSLGIQVCQGLLDYYDSWKGYKTAISSARRSPCSRSHSAVLALDQARAARHASTLALVVLTSSKRSFRSFGPTPFPARSDRRRGRKLKDYTGTLKRNNVVNDSIV